MITSTALEAAAVMIILAGAALQPAHADTKAEFERGCKEGHGSYIEDVDSVKCNTSGGTTITCDYKITHCTASAQAILSKNIAPSAGVLQEYMTGKAKITAPHDWKLINPQSKN